MVLVDESFSCEIKNVHITLGSYFSEISHQENEGNKSKKVIYTVGFTSKKACEPFEAILQVEVGSSIIQFFAESSRTYSIPSSKAEGADSHFYFFSVTDAIPNKSKFKYRIVSKTEVAGPFYFSSYFYSGNIDSIKVFSEHDHKRIGVKTIQRLEEEEYDLLILNGNFAHYYHSEEGETGNQYFQAMQRLMTKTPVIIMPGKRENFDRFNMFNNRFVMPGAKSAADNAVFRFALGKNVFIAINLEAVLQEEVYGSVVFQNLIEKFEEFLKEAAASNPSSILVITNVALYCSSGKVGGCHSNLLYLKPFEDLMDKYKVNLVLTSGVKFYETVKPVYSLKPKRYSSFLYINTGAGGATNFISNTPLRVESFSTKLIRNTPGYVTIYFNNNFIQTVFVMVKDKKILDLRFIALSSDTLYEALKTFGIFIILATLFLYQVIRSEYVVLLFINKSSKTYDRDMAIYRKLVA